MSLLVPHLGQSKMLETIVRQDLTLRLFINDKTPAWWDKASGYVEPKGNGYFPIPLKWAEWEVTVAPPITASYPEQLFTFTGAVGDVYGYYVLHDKSGVMMWAERFPNAPFQIKNEGDQIKIELTLKYGSK